MVRSNREEELLSESTNVLIHSQNIKFVLLQGFLSRESSTSVFYAHLESCAKITRDEEIRLNEPRLIVYSYY